MCRHRHNSASAIPHQHVITYPNRVFFTCEGAHKILASKHAVFGAFGIAFHSAFFAGLLNKCQCVRLIVSARYPFNHFWVFRCQYHIGNAKYRIRARCVYPNWV